MISDWIERVYGDLPGSLVVSCLPAVGKFVGTGGQRHTHAEAAELASELDQQGAKGVYLRVSTVKRVLGAGERGSESDSWWLPGLWADLDFGSVGHKHNPDQPDALPLPPDEGEARLVIAHSGLPDPTLWVRSGGGLYPWWMIDGGVEIDDANRAEIKTLSVAWQSEILRSSNALGYHYGEGVGDLARVLRIPGTTNRKAGLERPCRVLEDSGQVYLLDDLTKAVLGHLESVRAAPEPVESITAADRSRNGEERPLDRFERTNSWADILEPHGWRECGQRHGRDYAECWRRPGEPESPCSAHVLAAHPYVLVNWSDAAGLPTGGGKQLTKARVYAELNHGGDMSKAAGALAAQYGMTPLSEAELSAMSAEWLDSESTVSDGSTGAQIGTGDPDQVPVPSTWARIDLTAYSSGDYEPPEAGILHRTDGVGLFYPGLVHSVHGESESGKSWIAQIGTALELRRGHRVLYADFESDPGSVVGRLLLLGCTPEQINTLLDYRRPEESPKTVAALRDWQDMLTGSYALAVIDGVTDAIGTFKLAQGGSNDNDAVAEFLREFPRKLADRTGAAVILVDHVVKNGDARGRFAIGGQAKMAGLSGASYSAKQTRTLGRGLVGEVTLRIGKDRPGGIRPHCGSTDAHQSQEAARITIDSTGPVICWQVGGPRDSGEAGGSHQVRPTNLMEKASRFVEENPGSSQAAVLRVVKGKQWALILALRLLREGGYLLGEPGPRNSTVHTSIRPYREGDDRRDTVEGSEHPENDRDRVRVLREGHGGHGQVTVSGTRSGHGRDTVDTVETEPTNPSPPESSRAEARPDPDLGSEGPEADPRPGLGTPGDSSPETEPVPVELTKVGQHITCTRCGRPNMRVTAAGQTTHPFCRPADLGSEAQP